MTVANQARIYMKPIAERWTKKKLLKGRGKKPAKLCQQLGKLWHSKEQLATARE